MKGVVHSINRNRGMVAIKTDDHGFTIIELLADERIDVGDCMEWINDTGCGHQKYTNHTKCAAMEVHVQNHWVNTEHVKEQLLLD
jgi:hypothetical protein